MANIGLLRVGVAGIPSVSYYFFRGNLELYQDDHIRSALSVYPANTNEQNEIPHRVADLLLGGVLVKIKLTGGTVLRPKVATLVCAFDRLPLLKSHPTYGLVGKTLTGYGIIRSVNVPRDMVLR